MSGRVRDEFARLGWEAWSADLLPCERADCDFRDVRSVLYDDEHGGLHGSARHYQGDVRDLFRWDHPVNQARRWESKGADLSGRLGLRTQGIPLWNLAVLHPPCDHLSQAGARYWRLKDAARGGDGRMQEGAAFFMEMTEAPAPLVAVENPVGVMGLPRQACYHRRPDQVVQPWWFGDPVAKATCLWLKGLPPLVPDHVVAPEGRVATGGGSWRTDQGSGRGANNGHEDSEGRKMRKVVRSRTMPGFARAMASQWSKFYDEQEKVT